MRRTVLALVAVASCGGAPPQPQSIAVQAALGSEADPRFARALEPRAFAFPADHGAHDDFRTEWWYFTGNLATPDARRFAYQLTFFRNALAAEDTPRASAWGTRQLYLAHFAVTDPDAGEHHARERFSRGAAGLAGARSDGFHVWLEDWSAVALGGDGLGVQLRAAADDFAIDLALSSDRPVVLQGDRGFSRKGPGAGNASYYYSFTRLTSSGCIRIGDTEHAVTGGSWLDREWSTSVLASHQVGWDWFSLQLEDGREAMLFQLRDADGEPDEHSSGTLVAADGSSRHLDGDDFSLEPVRWWTSAASDARYPVAWQVTVPSAGLDLRVEAILDDQEMQVSVRYWEGAVDVRDAGGKALGRGYLEMTGYESRANSAATSSSKPGSSGLSSRSVTRSD